MQRMAFAQRASRTHIIIAVVGLLTFVSTFAYLQSLDQKFTVAQLSQNVDAGNPITKNDVTFVEVTYDELLAKSFLTESDLEKKKVVARVDLSSADLLTDSNTIRQSTLPGLQSLSIGIDADRANGGDIKKGDLIDIWQTGQDSSLIANSVSVRNVIEPNKRLGISTSKTLTIVLAVTPAQARDISSIVGSSDVMVVLSTGSALASASKELDTSTSDDNLSSQQFEPLNDPQALESSGE